MAPSPVTTTFTDPKQPASSSAIGTYPSNPNINSYYFSPSGNAPGDVSAPGMPMQGIAGTPLPLSSPSSNPHAGFHPQSFGFNYPYSYAGYGSSSSNGSSSLGMSISPPYWSGGGRWGTTAPPGSYAGSLGMMGSSIGRDFGTSFGRERDRELEATYVRDFSCCGRRLRSLHELLEHYEEEHANMPPEVRMAAINAAQMAAGSQGSGMPARAPSMSDGTRRRDSRTGGNSFPSQHNASGLAGAVPTPPGMMDIEMEDPAHNVQNGNRLHQAQAPPIAPIANSNPALPLWAGAFRTPSMPTGLNPQGVPPSLLSFTPPPSEGGRPGGPLTQEQLQAKAIRKAQRKAEKAAAREEASASDNEGEKKFACPIEGCGKVYKQANGLKYHLTRSINSGHGNVAAMGGLVGLLGDKANELSGD